MIFSCKHGILLLFDLIRWVMAFFLSGKVEQQQQQDRLWDLVFISILICFVYFGCIYTQKMDNKPIKMDGWDVFLHFLFYFRDEKCIRSLKRDLLGRCFKCAFPFSVYTRKVNIQFHPISECQTNWNSWIYVYFNGDVSWGQFVLWQGNFPSKCA
jgi:hypothetical protein